MLFYLITIVGFILCIAALTLRHRRETVSLITRMHEGMHESYGQGMREGMDKGYKAGQEANFVTLSNHERTQQLYEVQRDAHDPTKTTGTDIHVIPKLVIGPSAIAETTNIAQAVKIIRDETGKCIRTDPPAEPRGTLGNHTQIGRLMRGDGLLDDNKINRTPQVGG